MPTSDVLAGSLRLISLPGLLQVLSAERRSGRLALAVEGAPVGALWLADGAVVHAEATPPAGGARAEGAEALALLLALEHGVFAFESAPSPPRRTLEATTEHLLVEAACRRDAARRDLEGDLPPDAVPAFAPLDAAGGDGRPSLTTSQWRLLSLVDGRRDVAEIARRSGLPVRAASCVLGELVEAGVLRLP